jgi:hypothetical protein
VCVSNHSYEGGTQHACNHLHVLCFFHSHAFTVAEYACVQHSIEMCKAIGCVVAGSLGSSLTHTHTRVLAAALLDSQFLC